VNQATPTINGTILRHHVRTALSSTQLNATASVPGSFVYTPAAVQCLTQAMARTLSVTFHPADTANYNTASASVTINVLKASQTITVDTLRWKRCL